MCGIEKKGVSGADLKPQGAQPWISKQNENGAEAPQLILPANSQLLTRLDTREGRTEQKKYVVWFGSDKSLMRNGNCHSCNELEDIA
jgi:hypothetical protein